MRTWEPERCACFCPVTTQPARLSPHIRQSAPLFASGVRQECAERLASVDLGKRLQAESYEKKITKLTKREEDARLAARNIYECERVSHKKVARAIEEVSDVAQHVQLAKGAMKEVYTAAREAVANSPPERRAALEAKLQRGGLALSASQHAISQVAASAGREVVASSQMMRAADKAVHMNMQGGW